MKVEWLAPAKVDLREIFDYYSSVASERVARKIVAKIAAKTQTLARNPRMSQREWLLEDRPEEFRRVIVDRHKIIFYIEDDTVWITTVFDTRRNPATLLKIVTRRVNNN
jgi:plasmid stabilization system protein ParE